MQRGWSIDDQFEQEETKELATIRFCHWKHKDILVDLLFASSGIETEVVQLAEYIEVFPNINVRVARIGHLIALKLLSETKRRSQDTTDLNKLLEEANIEEIELAKEACSLITERGYHRGRDLLKRLQAHLDYE